MLNQECRLLDADALAVGEQCGGLVASKETRLLQVVELRALEQNDMLLSMGCSGSGAEPLGRVAGDPTSRANHRDGGAPGESTAGSSPDSAARRDATDGRGGCLRRRQYSQVSAGGGITCALQSRNQRAQCWYGRGLTHQPHDVELMQISAGSGHSCGLTLAGQVECWNRVYWTSPADGEYTSVSAGSPREGRGGNGRRSSCHDFELWRQRFGRKGRAQRGWSPRRNCRAFLLRRVPRVRLESLLTPTKREHPAARFSAPN